MLIPALYYPKAEVSLLFSRSRMASKTPIGPKTLQQSCEDEVISALSLRSVKDFKLSFSCGGVVPEVSNVSLLYKKKSGEWSPQPLQLPGRRHGGR